MNKYARKIQKLLFKEQWSLLVCDAAGNLIRQIVPPEDRIWADPFPVEVNGHYYIFIEQQFKNKNGTLGFIELYENLEYSAFTQILQKDYHLSYPHIFKIENGAKAVWYMIPETHENKKIDLYRAENFPNEWVFDSTLIENIDAVDSSVLFQNDKWWLFTSSAENGRGLNDSLSIFYSDTFPSTHWVAHKQNPVVIDRGNSRMGGKISLDESGSFNLRPAQSCTKEYGERLEINAIRELTPESYREEIVAEVTPEHNLHAVCTHTLNKCGKYTIRDIKTRRFRI